MEADTSEIQQQVTEKTIRQSRDRFQELFGETIILPEIKVHDGLFKAHRANEYLTEISG